MIAGYENSPSSSSNLVTACQVLPSSTERARFNGVRASFESLYARYQSPLAARTPSMPLLGLGSSVGFASDQVLPPSADSAWQTKPRPRDRHRATTVLSFRSNSVGWISPCGLSGTAIGPCRCHVLPPSVDRSAQAAHAL